MYARCHPPERRRTEIETSSNNTWFFLQVRVFLVRVLLVLFLLVRVLLVLFLLVRVLLIRVLLIRLLLVCVLLVRLLLVRVLLVQSSPVQSAKYSMPHMLGADQFIEFIFTHDRKEEWKLVLRSQSPT